MFRLKAEELRIESFRLVTTLLDHKRAPAAKLAALYHQRWENENGYAELKNRLRGAAFILRSCPDCHGFYGASSMERLPVEVALTATTREFKQIARPPRAGG